MSFARQMSRDTDSLIRSMGGGRKITLRRYVETSDVVAAKTTRSAAVETIVAGVLEGRFKRDEFNGQRSSDVKLMVSGQDLGTVRLDSSWSGQLDGGREHPIVIPTNAVAPDGEAITGQVVALRKGSAGP